MNSKIVSIKRTSTIFLAIVLVTGTIALSFSLSSFITAYSQVQPSYYNNGIDNNYQFQKNSVNINKIKCINDNININGENTGDVNIGNKKGQGYFGANSYGGEGYYDAYGNDNKQGKGFDDCVIDNNNNNNNTNIISGGGNQTVPEPEPATLTVKKQVFGCDNIQDIAFLKVMNCQFFQNNSPAWLDCNTNPAISGTVFCQSLSESIFDIEVLDDQSTQIQQFEGSTEGTTIHNLEPGTYTVNEIKNATFDALDQLVEFADAEIACVGAGFSDGGRLDNSTLFTAYPRICFEYEDEQGNDCSTITLAAGEQRTCTVKNYIRLSNQG